MGDATAKGHGKAARKCGTMARPSPERAELAQPQRRGEVASVNNVPKVDEPAALSVVQSQQGA